MSARFEELDWRDTPMGTISLRRRTEPTLRVDVFEVKLDEDYLMSSLFTVAEEELAHLGLAVHTGRDLDVLVGGLGLGYTAQAVLAHERVRSMVVVDALDVVLDWHRRGLLPVSGSLTSDPRTRLVHTDFFALMRGDPEQQWDVILVDIDHSPRHVLDPSHADFYDVDGLRRLGRHLAPAGVLAVWSDDPPDADFEDVLADVFRTSDARVVTFPNPLTRGESANTVYVGHGLR